MKTTPPCSSSQQRAQHPAWTAPTGKQGVEAAVVALDEARLAGRSQSEVRSRCKEVIAAYDRAIVSAEADLNALLGPIDGMSRTKVMAARHGSAAQASQRVLDRLRLARQRHLLTASPACGPSYADAATADTPLGPYWPQTDYLPEREVYGTRRILSPR
ncbi:MAG: hypothetical protein ACLGIA_09915 [Actinomycetes bacterium]